MSSPRQSRQRLNQRLSRRRRSISPQGQPTAQNRERIRDIYHSIRRQPYEYSTNWMASNYNSNDTCPICLEPLSDEVFSHKQNNIYHDFHKACVDQWFNAHGNCPTCRQNFGTRRQQEYDNDRSVRMRTSDSIDINNYDWSPAFDLGSPEFSLVNDSIVDELNLGYTYNDNWKITKDYNPQNTCSICLNELENEETEENEEILCHNGIHYFHKSCIDPWYSVNGKCPNCRGNFGKRRKRISH